MSLLGHGSEAFMMNKDRSLNGSWRIGKKPIRQAIKEKPKEEKKEGEEWQEQLPNP
tara:strand:- start:22 stop:189 length:168 start_codon:yes stop_codon:yes gene_type:complete